MEIFGSFYGALTPEPWAPALLFVLGFLILGYWGLPLALWTLMAAAALIGFGAPAVVLGVFAVVALVFNIPPVRQYLVSTIVLKTFKALGFLPKISETERVALEAGEVWVEADLFSGKPDFKKLLQEPYPELTAEEKAFLDGPVEKICQMQSDWDFWNTREMKPEVWDLIKKERLLGMIIPKEYGGLGFSANAHSAVIQKLTSRSVPMAVTVMVPNSLGPAELLNHYGTKQQKDYLLPRLARGEEIPCFALTEPTAGSDAGSLTASGVLFKGTDGKFYVRLNWNKRWITLAAISSIIGVAFRLKDPENILGKGEDVGITCALVPASTQGVVIGRRHDPLGVPFYNCPTQGKDVVISVDHIVGGIEGAGRGWKMLMESLAAGRGISLPAQSAGGVKLGALVTSAHATVRKQFGVSIGKFEGVEEPLSRIGGFNYMLEALRRFTVGGIDKGLKPPVVTAIAKYHATEIGRKVVNHAMDILGGAGISCGPRNTIASQYISTPIGITVEGANIMTRTLIIFGQGALRAHPYAFKEVRAVESNDLTGFDRAFWGHIGHVVRNTIRAFVLSATRARFVIPAAGGGVGRYYQKLTWASASFAILADLAMGTMGGTLKFREKITGRFADILSWMYIGFAVLRRYEAEGRKSEDLPFVQWAMGYAFSQMQHAFSGILGNFDVPVLGWFFRGPLRTWTSMNPISESPTDKQVHRIATLMQTDSEQRRRFAEGIFVPKDAQTEQIARLEYAFKVVKKSEASDKKIRDAVKSGKLQKKKGLQLYDDALKASVITQEEYENLKNTEQIRYEAIQVDDFSQEEYLGHKPTTTMGVNNEKKEIPRVVGH